VNDTCLISSCRWFYGGVYSVGFNNGRLCLHQHPLRCVQFHIVLLITLSRCAADLGRTQATGTELDVPKVAQLVSQAVEAVRTKPTCLHSVRDTSRSVWSSNDTVFAH
jgi:hypothetical protein